MNPQETCYFIFKKLKFHRFSNVGSPWHELAAMYDFTPPYYAGHITKTIKWKNILFCAIQIRHTKSLIISEMKNMTRAEFEKSSIEMMGLKFEECPYEYGLVCMLVDSSIIDPTLNGEKNNMRISAGVMFCYKHFMAQTPFLIKQVDSLLLRQRLWCRYPTSDLKLSAEFVKPVWFWQAYSQNIILSGFSITESVLLFFDVRDTISSELILSSIKVDLLAICTISSVTSVYTTNLLTYKCSIPFKSMNGFYSKGKNKLFIPKHCYYCSLPSVGPSFSAKSIVRSYALRFTVSVTEKYRTFNLQTIMNISIAIGDTSIETLTHQPRIPQSLGEIGESGGMFRKIQINYIDWQHLYTYSENDEIGKFLGRLVDHGIKYVSHETVSLESEYYAKSLTTVECYKPKFVNFKISENFAKYVLAIQQCKFGEQFFERIRSGSIVYKAYELNIKNSTYPMYFVGSVCVPSYRNPLINFPSQIMWYEQEEKLQSTHIFSASRNGRRKRIEITLSPHFVRPNIFTQYVDACIALPGMNVRDLFVFKLLTRREALSPNSQENEIPLAIIDIQIDLLEKHHATSLDYEVSPVVAFETTNSKKIHKNECYEVIRWKPGILSPDSLEYRVPKELIDAKLPEVGPTFFKNTHARIYSLKVSVTLCLAWGHQEKVLSICHDINIASPPDSPPYI